jgi:FMN phosphatase YigB (HAD superfamily)
MTQSYQAIIFDMGEVLFSWTPTDHPSVPLSTLASMIRSDLWNDFERGQVSAEQCYQQLGDQFSINPTEIAAAFRSASAALMPNDQMTALVQDIKRHCTGTSVVMMTNIPRPDFETLREREYIWESFDWVFASCHAGMRKPEERFYRLVLDSAGVSEPARAIFIDDRLENVIAARELGMQAVHCTDVTAACREVRGMLGI